MKDELIPVVALPRVPILTHAEAAHWREVLSQPQPASRQYMASPARCSPHAFALEVKDNSLSPRINAGNFIVIDPDRACAPGDFVLAKRTTGKPIHRKLVETPNGLALKALFPTWRQDMIPLNQGVTIIGRIIGRMDIDL